MKSYPSTAQNESALKDLLAQSSDFKSSDLLISGLSYRLFYINTMIESTVVQDHIIRPLLHHPDMMVREAVSVLDYSETDLLTVAAKSLVEGKTIIQIDGDAKLYMLGTDLKKERSVNIPVNERVLRGSNEALIEKLDTNINLLRKLISSPDLAVKNFTLGRRSNTKVAVLYLESIANKEIVTEFNRRLESIDIDYVEAPGFLLELIREKRFSLFPQILVTERPDRVRSYLMDGKIAILTEGSPDCLIVPVSFWAFFQTPDDYQIGWLLGSAFRFLRILSFIISISLPAAYVALVTFDPRILPFKIALTLQSSLQYISLPPIFEAIFMLVTLEILREATVRLASPVGQTIGIVGGIVIGTVVVQSNLISNMMVIVIAFTAVASFIIPSYEMSSAARFLSYPFIVMSSLFGLIGLEISYLLVLAHMARMHTMGIPYFYSGIGDGAIKDTIFRGPLGSLKKRPKESLAQDEVRIRVPRRWKN